MERMGKIAAIENEVEAMCLQGELQERGIPHMMRSYHDSAYDGLFQYSGGWGHVEAPVEYADQIRDVLTEMRERAFSQSDETVEPHDEGDLD